MVFPEFPWSQRRFWGLVYLNCAGKGFVGLGLKMPTPGRISEFSPGLQIIVCF